MKRTLINLCSKLKFICFLFFLIPVMGNSASFALEIPLSVKEPAGISRTNEPITSGIPLPAGTQTSNWSLWEGNAEIPLQITKLPGRTPWILLDFQTSVNAGVTKTLTLRDTPSSESPSDSVTISEDSNQIIVNTGPIEATISKTNFNLFDSVKLNGVQVASSAGNNIELIDATTENTYSGVGIPTNIEWDYQGPMRSTLRVDGSFAGFPNGLGYTTRITFYAGKAEVKIEYVIRNSYQPNERSVKIKSAKLIIGNGAASVRSSQPGDTSWANIESSGANFEIMPPRFIKASTGYLVNIDTNGGMPILDLSYHGASLIADFSENLSANDKTQLSNSVKSPLFAMARPSWYSEYGELTSSQFSTLDDEKQAYQKWGWAPTCSWSYDQEPTDSHKPDYYVSGKEVFSIHGESEADDLWQNLIMYLRTEQRGYLDRTLAWGRFFKWDYAFRTDGFNYDWDGGGEYPKTPRPKINISLTSDDNTILGYFRKGKHDVNQQNNGCHTYGWGLVDYYYLTGDKDALLAAIDIAEVSHKSHMWETPGDPERAPGGSTRAISRKWLVPIRVYEATLDQKWKDLIDHFAQLWLQSPYWDEKGAYASTWGYEGVDYDKTIRVVHNGYASWAFYRYYKATGNTAIRDKLLEMAKFAKQYALHNHTNHSVNYEYSSSYVSLDHPNPGDIYYINYDLPTGTFDPVYTITWIDNLVRGYRLTGDQSYLAKAKRVWEQGSKSLGGWPPSRTCGDNEIGRFVNAKFDEPYYDYNKGDLTYNHLLFYDYSHLGPSDNIAPSPPKNLRNR